MLKGFDLFKTSTAGPVDPAANKIKLNPVQIKRLVERIGLGNHTYLVVMYNGMKEVIRYDCTELAEDMANPKEIPVTRDVQNTGRKTFPSGACIQFQWTEESLVELILQTKGELHELPT